jgi:hypothetical protein
LILVYSHKLTNRLRYTFKTIFTDVLLVEVTFTDDLELFKNSDHPKINYSFNKIDDGLFFQSFSLLFENGIKEQYLSFFEYEENKCFFNVGKESILPFDPFAACFYLISRYEEYLPHIRDEHDRFLATESVAFQQNFLTIPLVNIWINKVEKIIKEKYPSFIFPERKFNYQSTIDIDNAFSIKHKGIIRTIGGLFKSLISTHDLKERISVIFNKENDAFDTFDYQNEIHKKYNTKPLYFFLLGDYGLNDKNIPVKNKTFQSLIKSIADYYEVGIHPSYASNKDINILTKEINRLQEITHRNTTKSRQHFLKLNLPETYQNLIDNDILEDYTMGYADKCGFRASICSPYYFYDLDTETSTKLKINPFAVMEATYMYYEKVDAINASQQIEKIMQKVKAVNGTFISVWHNESLSEKGIWKGWKAVYEKMLNAGLNSN